MDNIEIAQILSQIADILEIIDANQFRVIAYRRAAQIIETLTEDIHQIYQQNALEQIPGVGKGIAEKIKELIETGECKGFEKLKKKIPLSVLKLLNVEGLGPKKIKLFYKKYGVKTIPQLEKLAKSHKLLKLKGWGQKSEKNILRGITLYKKFSQRFTLGEAYFLSQDILKQLKQSKLVNQTEVCGSVRRAKETIGDLDILATSEVPQKAIDFFTQLPMVRKVLAKGLTKANVIIKRGPETDLRVVKPGSFGAALHYFTGSKAHNIRIRRLGMEKGLRINEYGVYKIRNQKSGVKKLIKIGGEKEKDIFEAVGLPWIPPEIRENEGEIEAAKQNKLPKLVNLKQIQGDLHLHTNWSDGSDSILQMAEAAKKRGYKYIAITDHASPIKVTNGLNSERIVNYVRAIKQINQKIAGIKVLSGIEVDIQKNGQLYLPDNVLKKLDLVIAAIHSGFHLPKNEMTQRIIQAIKNPYVHILAHPTGRLINKREPYELDMEKILKIARQTNIIMEMNASWTRLDLNATQARLTKNKGVKMVISTDAHSANRLTMMQFGVATARRGWLEKGDIINTLPLEGLLKVLKRRDN